MSTLIENEEILEIGKEILGSRLASVEAPATMLCMNTASTTITATDWGYTLIHEDTEWDITQQEGEWHARAGKFEYIDPQPTRYDAISAIAGWDAADAIGRRRNATV